MKGALLADGKPIGGRGRLTNEQIDTLQKYYGNAIRGNRNDLTAMRAAVWAIYFHQRSTDDEPTHNFCGEWCPYKKAMSAGTEYKHTRNMPLAVMDTIKPVFKDLSETQLLKKCLEGYTQNANECLNGAIWRMCPKHKNHGFTAVATAVAIAVAVFNDGATSLLDIMKELQLQPGTFSRKFCKNKDTLRIMIAKRQAKEATLEARRAKRRRKLALDEQQEETEGYPYQSGAY